SSHCLQRSEIEEIDSLPLAVPARTVRHPAKLASRQKARIRTQRNSVTEKFAHLFFPLAVDVKPSVKRFAAAVNGAHQRRERTEVQQESRVFIGRSGVELDYEETTRPGVAQWVLRFA